MCLTGVDYFSTLGYQPGHRLPGRGRPLPGGHAGPRPGHPVRGPAHLPQVAAHSPHGQGSILMLEELLPRWRGKVFVLVLLGFAFTDFIITITLSAADATAHIIENPFVPRTASTTRCGVTLVLLAVLGAVFLKGFREAIGLAVGIVAVYLALNAVAAGGRALRGRAAPRACCRDWRQALFAQHGSPLAMLGLAAAPVPEAGPRASRASRPGVAVMPLVHGRPGRRPGAARAGRIRNTRKLLLTAALIMSVFLLGSSLVTTLLIPPEAFAEGRRGERPRAGLPRPRAPGRRASAPSTTSAPSRSSGSRGPRPWPAC